MPPPKNRAVRRASPGAAEEGGPMAYNKLNPLEKEMLIRLYRRNPNTKMSEFCAANGVSAGAFKSWVKKYDEGGLAALYRTKKEPTLLPEGVDESEENLRRELIRTRLELERLKKGYTRTLDADGRPTGFAPVSERSTKSLRRSPRSSG